MFCTNCGAQITEKAVVCIKCGVATANINNGTSAFGETPDGRFEWLTVLLLCFFLGGLGVHSFYTKKTSIGIAQLLTLGGCGIWTLVDFIMILTGGFKDGNGNSLYKK